MLIWKLIIVKYKKIAFLLIRTIWITAMLIIKEIKKDSRNQNLYQGEDDKKKAKEHTFFFIRKILIENEPKYLKKM